MLVADSKHTAPKFDLGWPTLNDPSVFFIAEIKILTDKSESQQIRLAIGQILDYTHTISRPPFEISPSSP